MASLYDIGIEGIKGIAPSTGWRGTPGLEGYPGVVLKVVSECKNEEDDRLTDLREQSSRTVCCHAGHWMGVVRDQKGKPQLHFFP
jgi:hypothetical protein